MSANPQKPLRTVVRRAQSRFIQIDEKCIHAMSLHAMAVYQQLRLLSDFSKDCDEVEITILNLAKLSKISERQTYKALNELEYTHYVVQRMNYYHFKYGKTNAYNVARDYNYFQNDQVLSHTAQQNQPVDKCVQNLSHTARDAGTPAPGAVTNIDHNISHKKQNNKTVPVSVFSCSEDIKKEIRNRSKSRDIPLNDDVVEQICFWISQESNPETISKRINAALKLVSKKSWNIPHGYKGITSQSILKKEQEYEKQKQELIERDAIIGQALFENLSIVRTAEECEIGRKRCSDLFKMLK